jgi:DNA-binding GntR family transcriptional regulator
VPAFEKKIRNKSPSQSSLLSVRPFLALSTTRYEMFANSLVADIESGRFPVGALLPPEPQLCAQSGLSRHTVREGVRKLVEMGLVSRQQGVGTRVISSQVGPNNFSAATSLEALFSYVSGTYLEIYDESWVHAGEKLARLLDCKVGQRWLQVSSYRYKQNDKLPLSHTVLFIPPAYEGIRQFLGEINHPVYQLIEKNYGHKVQDLQMDVSALSISTAMARKLHCRPNSPGLLVVRRYRGASDLGLSNSVSIYPQSRFQVSIRYRLNWAG